MAGASRDRRSRRPSTPGSRAIGYCAWLSSWINHIGSIGCQIKQRRSHRQIAQRLECDSVARVPRPRIVLADDELNLRKVLGAILLRDGYEVLEARDGEEALKLVADNANIAALITDLRM